MLPVAVLAGGLATRLGSVTANVPKLLLDLNGRPFADYQLEWMKSEGVKDVVYCLGHLGDQVVETLGDGAGWNMQFRYVLDGPRLLGTGGALQRALPLLGDRFFVLYGDSLLTCNLAEVSGAHLVSGKRCLMTVFENAGQWDASNIVYRDGAIEVYDKTERRPDMRHIDYGLGVLTPAAFASYTPGERLDLATVYQDQLRAGQLAAYEVKSRFYEIGSPEGLEETRRYLAGRNESVMTYARQHLDEAGRILQALDEDAIERVAEVLAGVRARGGRLFFLGVGGSAGNASHAVNDFRKLAGFEAYAPTDNVSELTARTNDEGWDTVFAAWLAGSRLRAEDGIVVFSVGGGSIEKNISPNLVKALQYAQQIGASIVGVVGRDGGYTARVATACVLVPTVNDATITPHSEAFQAVVWHLLVSHPLLKTAPTKWESTV